MEKEASADAGADFCGKHQSYMAFAF